MEDNYCPLAFHGIYVQRFANGKHSTAPCCLAEKSAPTSNKIDFNNDPHLTKIRKEFIAGNRPKECQQCWILEDLGGDSVRKFYISYYNINGLLLDNTALLYNVDYNTLPLCNAKCIICGPQFSSTWADAVGKTSTIINIIKNNYDHLDGLDLSTVKKIYFNGGEPLLTDEHVTVLQRITNLSEVDVVYNTNGSCYPSETALDLWTKVNSVQIYFSIDGIGERFEITRTPLKWSIVSENIEKINLLPNVKIGRTYTIGWHNVYDLEDTINWFEKLPKFDIEQFYVHYVNPGHYLSLNESSTSEKQQFAIELLKFKKFNKWYHSILNALNL